MGDEQIPPDEDEEEGSPTQPDAPDPRVVPPPFDRVLESFMDRPLREKGLDGILKEIKDVKIPE